MLEIDVRLLPARPLTLPPRLQEIAADCGCGGVTLEARGGAGEAGHDRPLGTIPQQGWQDQPGEGWSVSTLAAGCTLVCQRSNARVNSTHRRPGQMGVARASR